MNNLSIKECIKEKCKDKYEIINNDKEIDDINNKLFSSVNYKDIEKNLINLYSKQNVKDLELCAFKKCKNIKMIHQDKLKFIKNNIILYDIKLSNEFNKKYDNLIKLSLKPILNNQEYINFIVLLYLFEKIITNNIIDSNMKLFELMGEYKRCSKKYCRKFETKDEKNLISNIKDDDERNKIIREIYSNEKQIKLDKCINNKCNKKQLILIQELLKKFNNKIKLFNIKIPKDIQLPFVNKITEKDIPELIIKLNQISYLLKKYN